MEEPATPLEQLHQIEMFVRSLLSELTDDELEVAARHAVRDIRQTVANARKFLRDYDREEDARLQARILPQCLACLATLRQDILDASQYDVFGAVDVAHLTATIDQLIERLR
jgi:hypothetical protein